MAEIEVTIQEEAISTAVTEGDVTAPVTGDIVTVNIVSTSGSVISFNGRTGAVTPASGDYDADEITETATREFVTPEQKADIATNKSHAEGDGSDHADVATNSAHASGDGSDHADVASNTSHSTGDGSDHSDVASNSAKLAHITVTQAVDLDTIESRVNELDAAVVLKGEWDASGGTFPGSGSAQAGWAYIVSTGGTVDGVAFNAGDRILAILDNASTSTYASNWLKLDYTDQVLSVFGKTGTVTVAGFSEISENLADGDHVVVANASDSNTERKCLVSRIWTYILAKIVAVTNVSTWGFVLDEDDMASDSNTKLATQQSIKKYVDDNAGGGGGGGYN